MTAKYDNPFVFPRPLPEGKWTPAECADIMPRYTGITLHDYYVGCAMIAFYSNPTVFESALEKTDELRMGPLMVSANVINGMADAQMELRQQIKDAEDDNEH